MSNARLVAYTDINEVMGCDGCGVPLLYSTRVDVDEAAFVELCEDCSPDTTTHAITGLERLPIGDKHTHWHSVTCSCGWERRYVSRYRAEFMHAKHAVSPQPEETQ